MEIKLFKEFLYTTNPSAADKILHLEKNLIRITYQEQAA